MAGFIEERKKNRPPLGQHAGEDLGSRISDALETKPFLAHLEDLRWTIIKCLAVLVVGIIGCAFLARQILDLLYVPLRATGHDPKAILRNIGVVDPFSIHMEISLFGGVIVSLPLMLYFLAQFVLPALTPAEKKFLAPIFAGGALLFVGGVVFCYEFILRVTLEFFLGYNDYFDWGTMWTAKSLIDFEVQMLLGVGLIFEMPLVIVVLNLFGIVSAAQLASKRRHAAVIIFIVACCIIPSTDPFSLSMVSVPMYLLYEVCIRIARMVEKRRAARDA